MKTLTPNIDEFEVWVEPYREHPDDLVLDPKNPGRMFKLKDSGFCMNPNGETPFIGPMRQAWLAARKITLSRCALEDCRKLFEHTSKQKRIYCTQAHAHLANVRKSRIEKKSH